ncbi:MAG: hypothetical protein EHM40_02925 [Chloroflexi bacterium]|nr:MAG: hypothetical protein EHM40_02925 [Chloroflexota bacterium]
MNTHLVARTSCTPGEPTTYKAACGYISENKSEFKEDISKTDKSGNKSLIVTCERCLEIFGKERAEKILAEANSYWRLK